MVNPVKFDYQLPPFKLIPFDDMTKKEAQQYFDWFVSRIPENLAQLRGAVDETGYDSSRLDYSDESLVYLCRWFLENAEIIDVPEEEIRARSAKIAGMLSDIAVAKGGVVTETTQKSFFDHLYSQEPRKKITPLWHYIAIDIGIYYGECLLTRYRDKGLYYGFVTKPKKYIYLHKPVIRGIWQRAKNFDEHIETGEVYEGDADPIAAGKTLILDRITGDLNEKTLLELFRKRERLIINLHSPDNITDIQKMDEIRAHQFFAWYVDLIPYHIDLLKNNVISSYKSRFSDKSRLDYSADSLVYVWSWYLERVDFVIKEEQKKKEKQQVKKLIKSMEIDGVQIYQGLHVLALDVSIYFAETFRRHHESEGIRWGYVTEPKTLPYVNRPVLLGFKDPAYPVMDQVGIFSDLAVRVAKGDRNKDALVELYDEWNKRV